MLRGSNLKHFWPVFVLRNQLILLDYSRKQLTMQTTEEEEEEECQVSIVRGRSELLAEWICF